MSLIGGGTILICNYKLHLKILALQKSLIKHQEHAFKYIFNPDMFYDNNASERNVRIKGIAEVS